MDNKGAWAYTYYIAKGQMHHQGGALMGIGQDATATLKQPSIGHSLASSKKRPSLQVHWTLTNRERLTTGASKKE